MGNFEVFFYFVCFAIILGAVICNDVGNIQSINVEMNKPPKPRHPEAPVPGDEVLYVDLSERLEDLYKMIKNDILGGEILLF